jgi:hypothetical protein
MKIKFNKGDYLRGIAQAVIDNRGIVHIVPSYDGWYLKIGGFSDSIKFFDNKEDAILNARGIVSDDRIIVHEL